MVPSDRTRPASKGDSRLFMAKAEEFLCEAADALTAERWDAAGLAAIHAGISAGDAVLAYHGGIRSAGQDHRSAPELVERTLGPSSHDSVKHLKRLVAKKNTVEYEQRRLSHAEAVDLESHARRFVKWAISRLP
ncbi:MAG: hypothetical protein CVT60_02800 [Actinobacteria bacterium HGW-Actinobacteria-10]|jgi:hypothetical protein|nr:MAG: hypothetical protein CVT60_02800 [Actinobacteria bacterium HGW-Actinobacteria-10]